jgi:hypothetical protein
MATHTTATRFALRPVFERRLTDGAWWPENRRSSDQLGLLFAAWPPGAGRIARVLYSPPDWDDHPRSVGVPGGRVKTGSFPRDDTHQLTLSLLDGHRRSITVIPPDTPKREAKAILDGVIGLDVGGQSRLLVDNQREWDNEGGHL